MKHEWRKHEKQFYLPKSKPEIIHLPNFSFFTICGKGNPNDDFFAAHVAVLYSLAYAVKMSHRKGIAPKAYFDYSVYPLEGVWSLSDKAIATYDGTINKSELLFTLMIRQPDFVDQDFAKHILEQTQKNKPHHLLAQVKFEEVAEGTCVQMLHLGSYDNEAPSFELMENYIAQENYKRISKIHKEIYLNDARKVSPDKMKTVLRFGIESINN